MNKIMTFCKLKYQALKDLISLTSQDSIVYGPIVYDLLLYDLTDEHYILDILPVSTIYATYTTPHTIGELELKLNTKKFHIHRQNNPKSIVLDIKHVWNYQETLNACVSELEKVIIRELKDYFDALTALGTFRIIFTKELPKQKLTIYDSNFMCSEKFGQQYISLAKEIEMWKSKKINYSEDISKLEPIWFTERNLEVIFNIISGSGDEKCCVCQEIGDVVKLNCCNTVYHANCLHKLYIRNVKKDECIVCKHVGIIAEIQLWCKWFGVVGLVESSNVGGGSNGENSSLRERGSSNVGGGLGELREVENAFSRLIDRMEHSSGGNSQTISDLRGMENSFGRLLNDVEHSSTRNINEVLEIPNENSVWLGDENENERLDNPIYNYIAPSEDNISRLIRMGASENRSSAQSPLPIINSLPANLNVTFTNLLNSRLRRAIN